MRNFLIILLLALLIIPAGSALAQTDDDKGSIFVITTHKIAMPEDGSAKERDAMLKELFEVDKKNSKIISQIELRHMWGHDSRDWVIITEYASMDDMKEAGKISSELYKKKWPDKEKRNAFFQKLRKYFPYHSDEIYSELPQFRK